MAYRVSFVGLLFRLLGHVCANGQFHHSRTSQILHRVLASGYQKRLQLCTIRRAFCAREGTVRPGARR
uniref:Putative secreted protein n=1 Tax=Anopheles darlingi TaxID=43151 RepID=A0A2M4DKU1_ANODA